MFDYYGSDSNEKKSMSFKKNIYIVSQRSFEKIPYEKRIFFLHSNIHAKRLYISARASVNYIVYARYMEWLVDGRDFIIHKATPLLGRSLPVSIRNRSRKACSSKYANNVV